MLKKVLIFIFLFVGVFVFSACSSTKQTIKNENNEANLLGNDVDEYGCKNSAGYSWCEEKQKCLRVWEESCADSINDFLNEINTKTDLNFTFLGKDKFDWFLENNEKQELFGLKFIDLKVSEEKITKLFTYLKENTENSIYNEADSAISSMIGFRHNLDVCLLTSTFKNVKENSTGILEPQDSEKQIEIICGLYKK